MLIASGRLPPHHSLSVLCLSLGQDLVDRTDRAEYGRRAKMRRVEMAAVMQGLGSRAAWQRVGFVHESGRCLRRQTKIG